MKYIGIIAMARNRVIGFNGKLPWSYKKDLKFFKETTTGGQVIMGRKTWEGLGVPHLKNRTIWVLTNNNTYGWNQIFDASGNAMTNIFTDASQLPDQSYFVAGGLAVYLFMMPKIDEFLVTYIKKDYEGDTVMPSFEDAFAKEEVVMEDEDFVIKRLFEKK